MSIQFTLTKIPDSGELKDECGLPFACVVQPFGRSKWAIDDRPPEVQSKDILRCSDCYAYINRFCQLETMGWACCLCGAFMEFTPEHQRRYRKQGWEQLPELRSELLDLECNPYEGISSSDDDSEAGEAATVQAQQDPVAVPVYVALVDLCCSEEVLELIRSGLQAALEALPAASRFGLITFSHRVGLYEVNSEPGLQSSVRYVLLEPSDRHAPSAVQLEDALPLESLLAPVDACKDGIVAAVESMMPETVSVPIADETGDSRRGRNFGGALQAVLRYLSGALTLGGQRLTANATAERDPQTQASSVAGAYAGARLLAFLCGPPDLGRGCIWPDRTTQQQSSVGKTQSAPFIEPMTADFNLHSFPSSISQHTTPNDRASDNPATSVHPKAFEFYEEAAAAAASLAVCIELFVISPTGCGLAALEPLIAATGGTMFLYPAANQAALPQDIYRRLGSPLACGGLLRLRTSRGYRVTSCYGHIFPDDQFDNLFHIVSADPNDSFTFDLDYSSSAGIHTDGSDGSQPSMQMAFQYSIMVPTSDGSDVASGTPSRWVLKRRMRILTQSLPLATSVRQVVDSCDPDVVLTVLVHKLIEAAAEEGPAEGHALLYDWLAILAAQYNRCILGLLSDNPIQQPDVTFEAIEALQGLPRAVYGLLRSPLLVQWAGQHADTSTVTRLLWAALSPTDIRLAVYPLLSSFSSPDAQAFPSHSLSEAALTTSGAPIFLLDSYTEVLVYYTTAAMSGGTLPFPPPQSSLLRTTTANMRSGRRVTPRLRMLRGGIDDERPFYENLIEEPDRKLKEAGIKVGEGFVRFLEDVELEVQSLLQDARP